MIYLDNAATTRPNEHALERANAFLHDTFYNPSALYRGGVSAHAELEAARSELLGYIGDPSRFSLLFTSGGTEGDNQALFFARRGNVVTTAGEHAAVYESATELKNRGVEPRFAPVERDGRVNEEALLSLVDSSTALVSVVHVNNETGAVNDISSLARAVKRKNPRTLFHSDGVQAFGKLPFRLPPDVDLYTVSAHKIGGLKGTGALIKRKELALRPLLFGGGQEGGLRSGTENMFGIEVFRYAAEETFASLEKNSVHLRGLRERLFSRLEGTLTRISPEDGSPYILTVSAEGMRGEVLQRMLWDRGVVAGTGSACSSKHRFSRVLTACGYPERVLDGVLRLSFSPETGEEEIDRAAEAILAAVQEYKERV